MIGRRQNPTGGDLRPLPTWRGHDANCCSAARPGGSLVSGTKCRCASQSAPKGGSTRDRRTVVMRNACRAAPSCRRRPACRSRRPGARRHGSKVDIGSMSTIMSPRADTPPRASAPSSAERSQKTPCQSGASRARKSSMRGRCVLQPPTTRSVVHLAQGGPRAMPHTGRATRRCEPRPAQAAARPTTRPVPMHRRVLQHALGR